MTGTIAITGGAGFIGRHLVEDLRRRGREVRVVDRVAPCEAPFPWGLAGLGNLDVIHADVAERGSLDGAFGGVSAVVHLAGLSSVAACAERPLDAFRANALGTANVLDAARAAGVRRVVVASSRRVVEGATDAYTATKAIAERWTRVSSAGFPGGAVVARLTNVYGPGQAPGTVVSDFLVKALMGRVPFDGDERERVPLLYVGDAVAALALLASAESVPDEVAVGPGDDVPLVALAGLVAELAREDGVAVPGPVGRGEAAERRRLTIDPGLAALGWTPRTAWTDGVRQAWAAMRQREPVVGRTR